MHVMRLRRNHDETTTKPLEFYRQNDETSGLLKIIICVYTIFLYCRMVVSSFHRQNPNGFVTVSSWFRRGFVMVASSVFESAHTQAAND